MDTSTLNYLAICMYFLTVDAYAFSGGNLSWGSIELALVFNVKLLTLKVLYYETTDLESAIMKLSDNHLRCIISTCYSNTFENVIQGLIGQCQKLWYYICDIVTNLTYSNLHHLSVWCMVLCSM